MAFPLSSRVALTVDLPAEGICRGDVATIVEHHAAPTAGVKSGYSVEVFNASAKRARCSRCRRLPWSRGGGTRC